MATPTRVPGVDLRPEVLRPLVEWRDLVRLQWWERAWELLLSVPWLVGSVWAYSRCAGPGSMGGRVGWLAAGAVMSFFFFLTGLRQSHNAQHSCLGIGRRGHDGMLAALSVLMLASMHAIKVTHLHHHRHCLDDEDEEARHAAWPWWKVMVAGPWLIVRLHAGAWRLGKRRERAWIACELAAVVGACGLVWWMGLADGAMGRVGVGLRWHIAAMATGECMTAFFAVWIVHRECEADGQIARTQRGWMKNFVSYSMFYHLEHHLWPAVPTCHLPRLAERLDGVAPGVVGRQVV